MRRRVLIALTIILVVSGAVWFILARANLGGPIELPATRKALGLEVQLLDCRRLANGQIEVKMTVGGLGGACPGPNVHVGEIGLKCGNTEGGPTGGESGGPPDSPIPVTSRFQLSGPGDMVNVSLPLHIHRADKNISFKFANVTIASLPQTRTVRGYKVTLVAALDNCMPREPKWTEYVIFGDVGPARTGPCFGLQVETTLPEGFEESQESQPMRDSGGRDIPLSTIYAQMVNPPTPPTPSTPPFSPTLLEKVVGFFSPGAAARMMTKRMNANTSTVVWQSHPNGKYIYGYPVASKPKGRFAFELKGRLPADQKDTAVVTFGNVPVR